MKDFEEEVLLISMPWTTLIEPSLGLGILKSCLDRESIPNRVLHLNLNLLRYLKADTYEAIAESYVLNEFLFTGIFEDLVSVGQERTIKKKISELLKINRFNCWTLETVDSVYSLLLSLRNEIIPSYIDECVETILEFTNAKLICFTCMFDQTIPSLAVAKKIKHRTTSPSIAFGGYSLFGEVGRQIISVFDFVDFVCSGDGEETITKLYDACTNVCSFESVPNLYYRNGPTKNQIAFSFTKKSEINLSPDPNFDDFISDLDNLDKTEKIKITWTSIPLENSRGCWWGQKKHCVFCGIDDFTMKYSLKRDDIVLNSMRELSDKYAINCFRFSDYILPNEYFKTLLPKLSDNENKFTIACELKANLTFDKFELLKKAGFIDVQPGIESFSTNVLKNIDKGVTAVQNIYTLLLGKHFNIKINYNIIYDFPTDETSDYELSAKLIPLLYHLDPPYSSVPVSITRFSPMQTNPKRFGYEKEDVVHDEMYEMLFSKAFLKRNKFNLTDYCYYYQKPYRNSESLQALYRLLVFQVIYWTNEKKKREVVLEFENLKDGIVFSDSRYSEEKKFYSFEDKYRIFYNRFYAKIITLADVKKSCIDFADSDSVDQMIENLEDLGILYREGNTILLLATKKTKAQ